jgi:hypothetical protein
MTARRTGEVQWRHTPVLIRADIFAAAQEQGINISHECNRALAGIVGIDYRQQLLPQETVTAPVIIAVEPLSSPEQPGPGAGKKPLRPVMNADDPATPVHVKILKKESAVQNVRGETGSARHPAAQSRTGPAPAQKKERESAAKKKGRDDAIRRFVTTRLVRIDGSDGGENVIAKDEMYQLFVRWCRANSIAPAPDKRSFFVALKNKFVMKEGSVDGTPCWINVRLR